MSYRIEFASGAVKQLEALPQAIQRRVVTCLRRIAEDPNAAPNVRALRGRPGQLRAKVGDYRIVYRIEHDTVLLLVITIAHRRESYR